MAALMDEGRAKVNLTLRVIGRRTDGFHDLESVVAFADCADRVTLTPGSELSLKMSGRTFDSGAQNLPNPAAVIWTVTLLSTSIVVERGFPA